MAGESTSNGVTNGTQGIDRRCSAADGEWMDLEILLTTTGMDHEM